MSTHVPGSGQDRILKYVVLFSVSEDSCSYHHLDSSSESCTCSVFIVRRSSNYNAPITTLESQCPIFKVFLMFQIQRHFSTSVLVSAVPVISRSFFRCVRIIPLRTTSVLFSTPTPFNSNSILTQTGVTSPRLVSTWLPRRRSPHESSL